MWSVKFILKKKQDIVILHVSLVHVSACLFAVSQTSDFALLVGYVA